MKTIFTDDVEYVIASSPEEAQRTWARLVGEQARPYDPNTRAWTALPLDQTFTYHCDDETGEIESMAVREFVAKYGTDFYAAQL